MRKEVDGMRKTIAVLLLLLPVCGFATGYVTPHPTTLRRPTLTELEGFLAGDDTNKNQYDNPSYVCIQFARDLKVRANQARWNMSFVVVNFKAYISESNTKLRSIETGHAFNSVYLTNSTLVYVEPQSDRVFPDPESLIIDMGKHRSENPFVAIQVEMLTIGTIW